VSARLLRGAALVATFVPLALVVLPAPVLGQQPWKPSITWNTYLGGSAGDELHGVVTNDLQEVFVAGQTNSTDFPGGAGLPAASSSKDVVVTKFKEDGTLAWSRAFGGSGGDTAIDIQLVPNTSGQEVYVVGTLRSSTSGLSTMPSSTSAFPVKNAYRTGESDAFLARLNANGELRWLLFLGGTGSDEGLALAVEPNGGKVYVGGRTTSSPSSFAGTLAGGARGDDTDAFVLQVDVANPDTPTPTWVRVFGTTGSFASNADDEVTSVLVLGGSVYVGGVIGSDISADDASVMPIIEGFHKGESDGFVAKLRATGSVEWFTNVGGVGSSDVDEVHELLARPNQEGMLVVGVTNSSSFLSNESSGSDVDAFVLEMSTTGIRTGGLRVGGTGNERMTDGSNPPGQSHAAVDSFGHVYIVGRTSSRTDFAVNAFSETFQNNNFSSSDGFVAMVDPALTRVIWASYVGGVANNDEWVLGVSAGAQGQLTLVGYSDSPNALVRRDSGYDTSANGAMDGIVLRVEVDPTPPRAGDVEASIVQGSISATWGAFPDPSRNFSDPETRVVRYAWAIGTLEGGSDVLPFESKGATTTQGTANVETKEGTPYYVTVVATNGVGRETRVSKRVQLPLPGEEPGPGTDPDPEPVDPQSPLGWGCGSTGGGGWAGALGLVALASLLARRARRASTSER